MNKKYTSFGIAARLWILTCLVFGSGWLLYQLIFDHELEVVMPILAVICSAIGSIPVLVILYLLTMYFEDLQATTATKIKRLVITCYCCTIPYGLIGGNLIYIHFGTDQWFIEYLLKVLVASAALFACSMVALLLVNKQVTRFFSQNAGIPANTVHQTNDNYMETTQQPAFVAGNPKPDVNKTLFKGIITGVLILVMLIPTFFVSNLVTEREQRQQEVVKEVSSKWAAAQTLSGPYLVIPYTVIQTDAEHKPVITDKQLFVLPDNLEVTGDMTPEIRPRSIYKVLLYKSNIKTSGQFTIRIPKDINPESLLLGEAKICVGISDFKGIEEKMAINFNNTGYELAPGLPTSEIDSSGLSATIALTPGDFGKTISFNMGLKLKGSEQLHFVPLAGNSRFSIQSSWNAPSFDGNTLPSDRKVSDNGFAATWTFNKANLPFSTTFSSFKLNKRSFDFGVSMVQPADQYAKTSRSVKYAVLFIGLTFSLFFIVELMQKKPVHPMQYILVGLALVIFYTLLLSISEFVLFDKAYAIAAAATILLIALYAKSHFKSWATAGMFGAVLCGLYGFIFILIRLEDTALLVGSIGLFLVLALVMYASRKINWYGNTVTDTSIA